MHIDPLKVPPGYTLRRPTLWLQNLYVSCGAHDKVTSWPCTHVADSFRNGEGTCWLRGTKWTLVDNSGWIRSPKCSSVWHSVETQGGHTVSRIWKRFLCIYLCVTHTILLGIEIYEVQDELRRFRSVLRLFDKIGAENFISGVGNRIFKEQENKINSLLESDKSGQLLWPLSLSTNRKDITVITSHQLQKMGGKKKNGSPESSLGLR